MLVGTVEKQNLSPLLTKIAEDLYPRVPADLAPHFDLYMGLLGNVPEHCEKFFPYYFSIWFENKLGPRVTELARLAIANGTQCPLCLEVRYTDTINEADVAALPGADPRQLTPKEQAVVRFATGFGGNHFSVGKEHFDDLKKYFNDEEITELLLWSAMALGLGRILKVTQLVDASCPLPEKRKVGRAAAEATA